LSIVQEVPTDDFDTVNHDGVSAVAGQRLKVGSSLQHGTDIATESALDISEGPRALALRRPSRIKSLAVRTEHELFRGLFVGEPPLVEQLSRVAAPNSNYGRILAGSAHEFAIGRARDGSQRPRMSKSCGTDSSYRSVGE
jgi:hypothetical protein